MTLEVPRLASSSPGLADASAGDGRVKINPSAFRYIKLGTGNRLAKDCIERGIIRLGFDGVPHALCQAGDWEGVRKTLQGLGKKAGAATNQANQIEDFYTLGEDVLWVTFWDGKLWWAFAQPDVHQDQDNAYLTRYRRVATPRMLVHRHGVAMPQQPRRRACASKLQHQVDENRGLSGYAVQHRRRRLPPSPDQRRVRTAGE